MAGFLYFIPDRSAGLGEAELKGLGLGYALAGCQVQQNHLMASGPGNSAGLLLADAAHCDSGRFRYAPADQDWVELNLSPPPDTRSPPPVFLGRWKTDRIGPSDLIRQKPLDGHVVELADGNPWLCPVARGQVLDGDRFAWRHVLPQVVSLGVNGKWQPDGVVARYKRLWVLACRWWDARIAGVPEGAQPGDVVRLDFDGLHTSAVECLAANYRLGPQEASMLGLFDSDSARQILDALIDLPTMLALSAELEKKTESTPPDG